MQRWEYEGVGIDDEQVPPTPWPMANSWVAQARSAAADRTVLHEPTAVSVATVDADGLPDVRTVLMRFFDVDGPGFVSSRHSAKAAQVEAAPVMAASLTWTPLHRSIRFRGAAQEIPTATTDAYWQTRPWGSRISAWVSQQSHPVASREELERATEEYARRWPDGGHSDDVPVPPDWVGYRIDCSSVEFWAGRPDRLHDRIRYVRTGPGDLDAVGAWRHERLQP